MEGKNYWEGTEAANRRIMYLASGYEAEDIVNKPHIGIANTFFEGSPGTGHLRRLGESVKQGVWMNGGMPMEFGVPATCGNVATGSDGLRYELATRDVVAMSIETVARVHKLDGLVILASCDNIIAGAYLAALRTDIPAIIVTGGPMGVSVLREKPMVQADVDVAALKGDKELLDIIEEHVCPTFGACPSMGTANTMQILGEALNLVLPGTVTIPAAENLKLRKSVEAGRIIVELTKNAVRPSKLITRNVLLNTIMLDMAIAGSTNAILHIIAYGKELEISITLDDFDTIAKEIKTLVDVIPTGEYTIIDFYRWGGVPAVMKRLESKIYDEPTLLGISWKKYLETVKIDGGNIIHSLDDPVEDIAGLRVLKGNVAPRGAICRPRGMPRSMWKLQGTARVFDSEEDAVAAIEGDRIKEGDVIVIRYEGPKGSPGMNELMKATDRLIAGGMQEKVALISDGRFSGFNHGSIIGHISPEAYVGGAIAFIQDGDIAYYDIEEGTIGVNISDEEMEDRKKSWQHPDQKVKKGILSIYAATCRPAEEGAAMQN